MTVSHCAVPSWLDAETLGCVDPFWQYSCENLLRPQSVLQGRDTKPRCSPPVTQFLFRVRPVVTLPQSAANPPVLQIPVCTAPATSTASVGCAGAVAGLSAFVLIFKSELLLVLSTQGTEWARVRVQQIGPVHPDRPHGAQWLIPWSIHELNYL